MWRTRVPLRILVLHSVVVLASAGCAKHADFVDLREDVHALTKFQDQARKQQEAQQKRLQALETKIGETPASPTESERGMAPLKHQLDELTERLKLLEGRLARLEDAQSMVTGKLELGKLELGKPESGKGEPSRQSKPAPVPPPPPSVLPLPGTPDITPTSAYNLAYNDYLNGRYELAVSGFERFLQDFPSTSLASDAQYWLGESYYGERDYVRAMQAFEKVVTDYPHSDRVAPALYKLGLAAAQIGDARRAREYLKRVVQDFKDSNEAKLAKGKLAELR